MNTETSFAADYLQSHPLLVAILGHAGAILITLFIALVVLRLLSATKTRVSARLSARGGLTDVAAAEQQHRIETVLRVAYDVSRIVVLAFVVMTLLGQVGVSVQPLVAGAGLLGAAVALGSQTVVKDFVSGFFIVLEGHFVIGDTVVLGPLSGTVERMTLRVTVLRDVDGAVHIIPNGSIAAITNKTYRWSQSILTVGVPAANDQELVRAALGKAAAAVVARDPEKHSLLSEVIVGGPNTIRGTTIDWSMTVKVRIGEAANVKGWMVEEAVRALNEAKIPLSA